MIFADSMRQPLFMGLAAAVKAFLHLYTGNKDLVIGSPTAGRLHNDLENQIGCYLNTLPLRTIIEAEDSFEEIIGKIRTTTSGRIRTPTLSF